MQTIPAEHDARQFELVQQASRIADRLETVRNQMHRLAGDRKDWIGRRQYWRRTAAEIVRDLESAAKDTNPNIRLRTQAAEILRTEADLLGQLAQLTAQIDAMEATWREHRWTRYFPCLNADGHVHTSLNGCPTVNRGHSQTAMGWATELSGLPIEEAIRPENLGPRLCSVCYPGAPVEHCRSLRDITREEREAERDRKVQERQAAAEAKEQRRLAREAKAAEPRKETPQERRWAALKAIGGRYDELSAQGREDAAKAIRELDELGKAPKWHDAIEAWAGAVLNEDYDLRWAFFQWSVYAANAA